VVAEAVIAGAVVDVTAGAVAVIGVVVAAMNDDIPTDTLAETSSYVAWLSDEPDGESVYHLELGAVTLHFFQEEWQELVELITNANKAVNGG
jgi:hypothetical protein